MIWMQYPYSHVNYIFIWEGEGMTISLCMIVKNEEEVLARCLDSVQQIADEIVIVDTGSTDRTKEIAAAYTDKVYDFEWIEDFSAARNYGFSKATKEYCMWMDADDIITEENQKAILELKKTLSRDIDVVMLRYNIRFDESGNPTFSYFRERIVRNGKGYHWVGKVHEVIDTKGGKRFYSDAAVSHKKVRVSDSQRNLRIYEKQLAEEGVLCPRDMFYYARELYYHQYYIKAIEFLERYLTEGNGWLENIIEACKFLALCRYALQEDDAALEAYFKTLKYDTPRAEICCDIGKHFFNKKQYHQAIFWYETALTRKRNDQSGAFVQTDCYGYLPSIQLCVCYDRIGDIEKAKQYNEMAGSFNPKSSAYLKNKEYYQKRETSK